MNRLVNMGFVAVALCTSGLAGATKSSHTGQLSTHTNVAAGQLKSQKKFTFEGGKMGTAYHVKDLLEKAAPPVKTGQLNKIEEYYELEYRPLQPVFEKETNTLLTAIEALKANVGQHVTIRKHLGSGVVTRSGLIKSVELADKKLQGVAEGDPMKTPLHHVVFEDGKRVSLMHNQDTQLLDIEIGSGE